MNQIIIIIVNASSFTVASRNAAGAVAACSASAAAVGSAMTSRPTSVTRLSKHTITKSTLQTQGINLISCVKKYQRKK